MSRFQLRKRAGEASTTEEGPRWTFGSAGPLRPIVAPLPSNMARFPSLAFVALCRSPNRSPRGWAVTDNAPPVNADDDLKSDHETNRRNAGQIGSESGRTKKGK